MHYVEVFKARLFGTTQTNLSKGTCEKDTGEEKSKHTLNSHL